jgi:hypothetical protein
VSSDDRDDVDISIHIDFIEKLVGIALSIVMFQHLNKMAAFNQHDDLFEADSSLPDEPGVLVRIEGKLSFFHVRMLRRCVPVVNSVSFTE